MNTQLRNYILTMYENMNNLNKNESLETFANDFEKQKNSIKIHCNFIYELRFLYISIIILFLMLVIFPIWYANAFGFTKKEVVLKPLNNTLTIKSFNLGTIIGRLYIDNEIYHNNTFYKKGYVYYKGPFVMSNKIPIRYIQNNIIDSIVSIITPPKYQNKESQRIYGTVINISEFSMIDVNIFLKYDTIIKRKIPIIRNNNKTISIPIYSENIEFDLNIQKDKYPICEFLIDSSLNNNGMFVDLPFIAIDDYGMDYAGVIIKTFMDSTDIKINVRNDSIFIVRINIDSIKAEQFEVIAYAKDNNPYREQITYSQPIIMKNNKEKMLFEIQQYEYKDTLGEYTDNLISKFNRIKASIIKENRENTQKRIKEGIEQLKEFNEILNKELKKNSDNIISKEILKKMYEIKKQIEQLDKDIIESINSKIDNNDFEKMSRKTFNDFIKNNADKIIESLERLKSMLKQLNQMQMLDRLQKAMENLIEKQEKALKESNDRYKESQKDITKKLENLNSQMNMELLPDIKNAMEELTEISQKAENNRKMAEKLKEKMEQLKQKIQNQLNMNSKESIDKNAIIRTLYLLNFTIKDNFSKELCENVYKDIYNMIVKRDKGNAMASIIANGIKLTQLENTDAYDIIEYNFYIISMLLRKQQNQTGSSMQQLLQQLQSISKTEQAISQMLWDMFENGINAEQLESIAKKQMEMAEKLSQLSMDKSRKLLGNMQSIADSLKDLSEQLKSGKLNKSIIEKEKRILNRLLNLNKSVYRRGISEQRESKTGEDYNQKISIILPEDLGYSINNLKKRLFDFLKKYEYTEYKALLRMYYMEILK